MASTITETTPATSESAIAHFAGLLSCETDCWDVHDAMTSDEADFVLLDVRSASAYATGHAVGAVSMPRATITSDTLSVYEPDTVFVVYCNGPHCNGADKAALRLAKIGRPVKKMIGGVAGWLDEGFDLIPN